MSDDYIYTVIGDDGYGMTIKPAKAEKYAKQLRNAFVRKFDDPLSGYVWLSSQINDYNEEFYNSPRVLEQDDLVQLDDLIRKQYVVIPEKEVKKRDAKRKNRKKGCLYITFGKSATEEDFAPVLLVMAKMKGSQSWKILHRILLQKSERRKR